MQVEPPPSQLHCQEAVLSRQHCQWWCLDERALLLDGWALLLDGWALLLLLAAQTAALKGYCNTHTDGNTHNNGNTHSNGNTH